MEQPVHINPSSSNYKNTWLQINGWCPLWRVSLFTQQLWIVPSCAVTPNSLAAWHMMRLMLRRCQKSEHMQGDILAARGGIICLSPCHDWSVSEEDQRCDNTGIKWLAFVCSCLFAPELLCETASVKPRCGTHAPNTKKLAEKSLLMTFFPISTLSLDYKDDNSSKINATHLNAKKSVLILQKQSLLLSKLMTYHTMCFIH